MEMDEEEEEEEGGGEREGEGEGEERDAECEMEGRDDKIDHWAEKEKAWKKKLKYSKRSPPPLIKHSPPNIARYIHFVHAYENTCTCTCT